MKALKLHYRSQYSFLPEINLTVPERPATVPDITTYSKLSINFLHDVPSMTTMSLTVVEIISSSQSEVGKYQFVTSDNTLTDAKTGISLIVSDVFEEQTR